MNLCSLTSRTGFLHDLPVHPTGISGRVGLELSLDYHGEPAEFGAADGEARRAVRREAQDTGAEEEGDGGGAARGEAALDCNRVARGGGRRPGRRRSSC